MTLLSPFLSVSASCDQALQATKIELSQAGLSTVQTFDLSAARLGEHDCCCPNHGTAACDCQMIVLLVYGEAPEPVSVILHGNSGQTWISIADSAVQRANTELVTRICGALASIISVDS